MDSHRTTHGWSVLRFALTMLVAVNMAATVLAEAEKLEAEQEKPEADVTNKTEAVSPEAAREKPEDLSRTPLGTVGKWDAAECKANSGKVAARLKDLQREQHDATFAEARIRNGARTSGELPPEYKKLIAEVEELKKELAGKTKQLADYLSSTDAVKDVRKKQKDLGDEWRRLKVLEDAIRRQVQALKSKQKGAAD